MKFCIKILALLVAVWSPFSGYAWQLSGLVMDSLNQPIPYASVFIKNTTHGVATNLKGQYFLELKDGDYSLVVQTIGYEKKEVPFTIQGGSKKLNIILKQDITSLEEINISADREDPAYPIIRNAIANRKKFRTPTKSFACNTYIKASLQREFFTHDTLSRKARDTVANKLTKENMNFIETYGRAYYQAPNSWKEIKTAVKDLSENYNNFVKKGYEIIGVSADSEKRQLNFCVKNELPYNLLADEEKSIINAYGVWGPKKFMGREYDGIHRTTFIINENGFIENVITKVKTKVHTSQILDVVE